MKIRHLVIASLASGWLAAAAPVVADCQPAGPIAEEVGEAPLVFAGTVVEARTGEGAPPVRLRVEEVWTGSLPEEVIVNGLSDEETPVEDDRIWQIGVRYLVVPIIDGDVLRDSICTATSEWLAEYADLRTSNRSATTGADARFPALPVLLGLVAFVAVLVAAFGGYDRVTRRPEQDAGG